MSVKKYLSLSALILILSAPLFCQTVNFFTPENPKITTSFSIVNNFIPELCVSDLVAQNYVSADFTELFADAGVAFQDNRFDSASRIFYMPTFQRKYRYQIGLGLNHHCLRYYNIFTENDIAVSAIFRWFKSGFFDLEIAPGYMWKISSIDVLKNANPIVNDCFHLSVLTNFHFTPDFDFYLNFTTIDFFDYPLFSSPIIKTGFCYDFGNHFAFDMSASLKFYDMIVSAVMLNQCSVKTTLKVYY